MRHVPLPATLRVPLIVFGCAAAGTAHTATPEPAGADETITVVATRTERSLDQVDATISVIDREDIERQMMRDIADLVRYEPGVSVGGSGSRFGLEGFTIRGIGGNRVLTVVDGVRVPDEFSFGPFLSSRRDFFDIDTLARAEIARGPVSTLYGSDALGGVVALTTKGPQDYLDGEPFHAELKTGYAGDDNSVVGSLTGAWGNETVAALLTYTRRESEETDTQGRVEGTGPEREAPDPQDLETDSLVAKLTWNPAENHQFKLSAEAYQSDAATRVLSDYGTVSRGTLVNTLDADDTRDRERYSISYRYRGDGTLVDDAEVTLYHQSSDTEQFTEELRTPPGSGQQRRERESLFEQEIDGAYLQLNRSLSAAGVTHHLTLGGELYQTDSSSLRDGGTVDAASGAVIPEFLPLPTRDFPETTVEHRAVFLQNEIELLDGRLLVTPGVRWDEFTADTTADAIYENGNPGVGAPADYQDDEVTLKLGGVYRIRDGVSVWARYSEGFRAPPYDDVNVGFTNFIGGYKTISSPALESETSEGIEVGSRVSGSWGNVSVALFQTDYENFIESLAIAPQFAATGGIDPSDNLLTFQSVNRAAVRIEGWELRGALALGTLTPGLEDFYLEGAAAYARGEDRDSGAPINEIEPLNTVLGLRWAPADARWDAELVWSYSADKDASDIDGDRFATDSWNVVDLLAHMEITPQVSLDVGVFNLTDERYVRWADTASIGDDAPLRFSQPGRSLSATLRLAL